MTKPRMRPAAWPVLGLMLSLPASVALAHGSWGGGDRGDPEIAYKWNELVATTTPGTAGLQQIRYYAMVQVAIFDAVNSIEGDYSKFRFEVFAPRGGSTDAAAAYAAHTVMVSLIPANKAAYDAVLAEQTAGIPKGRLLIGALVGKTVGNKVLAWRQDDGWNQPAPPFNPPPLPGYWQPTPPGFGPALFGQYQIVEPFATSSATHFMAPRHPELTSQQYTDDFNEVKELGSATSTTRTADETLIARLWSGTGYVSNPFNTWNHVARSVGRSGGFSLIDASRMLALLNVGMHDGLQSSHSAKFLYAFWRPYTAIRGADVDTNPGTEADPNWTSLIVAPPYGSYPGNMSCIGAVSATLLGDIFGTDQVGFSVTWTGVAPNANVTRQYTGFWQAGYEEARSRVAGGIHFSFDNEISQERCPEVAYWILDRFAVARRH